MTLYPVVAMVQAAVALLALSVGFLFAGCQTLGPVAYVDDTEVASKRMFQQIQTLFLTRLSEATRGTQTTPLLTIPVK